MQPASVDVHLGDEVVERFGKTWDAIDRGPNATPKLLVVDPYSEEDTECAFSAPRLINPSGGYTLKAGQFVLATTAEIVTLGPNISAQVVGKSSIARHGLEIEAAGFIDPGFSGQITLELGLKAGGLKLFPGMKICQLVFHRLDTPTDVLYEGRYNGQRGPTPPRYYMNARPS